jgi:hypothetical protein
VASNRVSGLDHLQASHGDYLSVACDTNSS